MWKDALEKLGYHVAEHVLTASRYGVPQRRKRLFITATREAPLRVVEPDVQEPAFGPCVDWDAGDWRPISTVTGNARKRIDAGREGIGERFLVQHVTGHKGLSLDEPLRTVTTADQWGVVKGDLYRPLTLQENMRAMGFPDSYWYPEGIGRRQAIKGLGNAVCPPVATALVNQISAVI